jgi:uncharacterized protein (DUF2147 family)
VPNVLLKNNPCPFKPKNHVDLRIKIMKLIFAFPLGLALIASAAFARPLESTTWRTQSGAGTVRIEACGTKTCGRILTGTPKAGDTGLDFRNPNLALRTRTLIGTNILTNFVRQPDDSYKGGTIYNPEDGKTYRSEFKLKADGRLEVKGCVGPFCQTQIWTPVR